MKGILSKISIIFFFFLSSLFFSASPSFAQAKNVPINNSAAANTNLNVPNNLHNWTQSVMIETMSSLICQLTGVDPINPKQSCLGVDQKSGKIGFLPSPQTGGAIGFMGKMIATLYTPPLHTSDYFQNLAQNFGISKKTYAQRTGTGFQGLSPLIGVWSAFRNIVYLILVIIFVAIGLAIMLRIKIDPRTVMTIQNQIPKIIVGILAVTFSFAIAGFLVDMMWVLIYLSYGIVSGIPGVDVSTLNPSSIQGQTAMAAAGHISKGGIFGISWNIALNGSDMIKELFGIAPTTAQLNPFSGDIKSVTDFISWLNSITNIFGFGINSNPVSWLINVVSVGISFFVGFQWLGLNAPTVAGNSPGFIGNLLVALPAMIGVYAGANLILREVLPLLILYIIIFFAIFIALFRLWLTLLMAYVSILLDVVLAPFWLIGGILPGSQIGFGGWLKDIGANLLAFPATIFMFLLGKVFMDSFGKTPATGQNFVPPLIGNPGDPSLIGSLIGLGILLMTPNIISLLKQLLKAPKTNLMASVGQGIGAGVGVPTAAIRTGGSYFARTPMMGERGGIWGAIRNIGKF